jgi:hypothetical protein
VLLPLELNFPFFLRIALSHRQLGEYLLAERALNLQDFSPGFQVRAMHGAPLPPQTSTALLSSLAEISLNRLLSGSAEGSYELAKSATEACVSLRDPEYELFAPSYGLQVSTIPLSLCLSLNLSLSIALSGPFSAALGEVFSCRRVPPIVSTLV